MSCNIKTGRVETSRAEPPGVETGGTKSPETGGFETSRAETASVETGGIETGGESLVPTKSPSLPCHIVLLGCGHMGGAILQRWIETLPASVHFTIVTRTREKIGHFLDPKRVTWVKSGHPLSSKPDLFLIAVKPQHVEEALSPYLFFSDCLYMTIAAGLSLKFYQKYLGQDGKIIRTMPNLPVRIGAGLTGVYSDFSLNLSQKHRVEALLTPLGVILWLSKEEQFHAFTALAGSGPAYVFLFLEALIYAGQTQGFDSETATLIARQTVLGSLNMLACSSKSPGRLREEVTSPGGTTESALKILRMTGTINLESLIEQAINEAVKRSRGLGKELGSFPQE